MKRRRPTTRQISRRSNGYKSGLEERVAAQIEEVTGCSAAYETVTVEYSKPERKHRYRPDFVLPNGVIIESKGIFDAEDREKHLLIKQQHPELDIRFVFSRAEAPIYKGSKTTMRQWCEKHGYKWAEKLIPMEWFQ